MMKKSQKLAIFASLAMSLNFYGNASASDTDYVYYDGKKFIEFEFCNDGEFYSHYTLSDTIREATKSSTAYWTGIIAPRSRYSSPWQIIVANEKNVQNAGAATLSFQNGKHMYDNYPALMMQTGKELSYYDLKQLAGISLAGELKEEELIEVFQANSPKQGDSGISLLTIGQHFGANREGIIDGWWVDTDTVLPTNEQANDFVGTCRHELGHALGIASWARYCDWNGNTVGEKNRITYGDNKIPVSKFPDTIADKNNWMLHLVDKNGNHAKADMMIVTTEGFNRIRSIKPEAKQGDYFIVDEGDYAYFMGDQVTEALAGAKFNGISGLPVNAWEGERFEGSHLQTTGMMSHRDYSNYTGLMEVELAVMQDLGYDFDRKAYFGYSVYGDGLTFNNMQGYSARNAAGTAYTTDYSIVPLGIGLHVYGSLNHITQAADILTRGTGAVGIRVDGEENTIHIPRTTEIHADGKRGKGVLFAYGRDQKLNLAGTVTAKGEGGNAVEFNFGSSSNGSIDEYRGSYIRYERRGNEENGEITQGWNIKLNDMDKKKYNVSANELDGEMITDFDLSGKIMGGENAIYIGRNAFVKNININNGAEIKGKITSDWKHFSTEYGFWDTEQSTTYREKDDDGHVTTKTGKIKPLYIQYGGNDYGYKDYIPDLVTNLNFNGDIHYDSDISGSDNLKMNIAAGTMTFTGNADVVNVKVADGAALYGGNYIVNDMNNKMARGYKDDETGKFINHGTVGAVTKDTAMTIQGDLVSDGMLCAYGGGEKGHIEVTGNADVDGSTVAAFNMVPGETVTVLKAGRITGSIANPEGTPYKGFDLLDMTGIKEDKQVLVKAQAKENTALGFNAAQAATFNAMNDMSIALSAAGDNRRNELRPFYQMNAKTAGKALQEIGASETPHMAALVQQNTLAGRVISDRLSTAFSLQPVQVNVPVNHLADSEKTDGLKVNMELPVTQDNNAWVKFTKNWGDLDGGASYHGQAISGGYDRQLNKNWRGGVFLSYQAMSLGAASGSGNIYDTRLGLYAGYHKNAADAYLYADYGWIRNKMQRSLGMMGLGAEAEYDAHLLEIGGEYKYDLHADDGKIWHISPYIGFQLSRLQQDAYTENGAGIFNQQIAGMHNTYFAGNLGMEFKRYLKQGSYGLRMGVKHAFAGADPELSFRYEGNNGRNYTLRNSQDKTHFICSLSGETEFSKGWFLSGEAQLQKGAHDKDVSATVQFKRVW
ncbi:autotransporter domain-containing protein [Selenomonas ruminantium]|uniref:autotransporter outer membrane beta-barrel domain-containing protein n=1 Tax=Selenomonas ruminantium TaxID=971 RepID=UPI0026EF378A|nr:autotransporter outer membrane beta-barrel domain-containing protein [Selenomonas ruminantium]